MKTILSLLVPAIVASFLYPFFVFNEDAKNLPLECLKKRGIAYFSDANTQAKTERFCNVSDTRVDQQKKLF